MPDTYIPLGHSIDGAWPRNEHQPVCTACVHACYPPSNRGLTRTATRAVNAQYPRWFYAAWAAASMLPLVKGQRTEAEIAAGRDPDCRPVAIGEVDLRAIGRAVTLQVQQPAEAHLAPQQLGVAVKAFIGVPRAVIRDRHAGRREARAVPAQGPMQAAGRQTDFFRHQADIWQAAAG